MQKYGIDNVRGGPWCKINLSEADKQAITHINKSNSDSCYNCGSNDHFASQCTKQKTTYKKTKPVACERCGRTNHTADRCYATTDVEGYDLGIDEYDESDESEEESWVCSKCGKGFDSYKGASYHERFHCKKVNTSTKKSTYACKRCGRPGHTKSNCYAETHAKGYQLYY